MLKKIGIIFSIGVVSLILLFHVLAIVNTWLTFTESSYKNYGSLSRSRSLSFYPEVFPTEARSIYQRTNIDWQTIFFCFEISQENKRSFLDKLIPADEDFLEENNFMKPYHPLYDFWRPVAWWPSWLRGGEEWTPLKRVNEDVRFYSHVGDKWDTLFIFATKKDSRLICGWSVPD